MSKVQQLVESLVIVFAVCVMGLTISNTTSQTALAKVPDVGAVNRQLSAKQKDLANTKKYVSDATKRLNNAKAALKRQNNSRNRSTVNSLQGKINRANAKIKTLQKQISGLTSQKNRINRVNNKRNSAAKLAKTLPSKRIKYRWGGASLSGMDCSGLTQYVYRRVGVSLAHYTVSQEKQLTYESVGDAKPGDLLFWGRRGSSYHVAIYVGNGRYVHAPTFGQNVKTTAISAWRPSFAAHIRY